MVYLDSALGECDLRWLSLRLVRGNVTAAVQSLRSRMLGALRWVVMGTAGLHALRFASNLIITRLLAPEMFGLMAVATTVGVIMTMLSDIGLRPAVMRSPRGADPAFLDTVWVLQIIRGGLLWAGSIAVAIALYLANSWALVPVGSTYGNALLPALIVATGFSSVIIGLASTLSLSAIRRFDTKLPFKLDFVSTVVGLVVMIVLARTSHSIWSLVLGTYASTICGLVLSHWFMPAPRNRFRIERASLVEIFSLGKWLALSSAITVFATNGDRLLLGAFATPQTLGFYAIALSLVGALNIILGQVLNSVLMPAFCEVARNDEARLPHAYFRLRLRIDPIILAISGALFGSGPLLISVLYDARYAEVANLIQILALGMIVERFAMAEQVYLAINKPRYLVSINMVRLISTYSLVPIGYWLDGFTGAVIGVACRDLPILPLIFWFNSKHGLNNLKLELGLLAFWPAGLAFALVAEGAIRALRT